MAHIPRKRLVHTVSVRLRTGQTGSGRGIYGEAFEVRCLLAEKNGTTIGPDGEAAARTAQFVCRLDDGHKVEMLAEVTLPSGRKGRVVNVAHGDDGGRGAWQHSLVSIQ